MALSDAQREAYRQNHDGILADALAAAGSLTKLARALGVGRTTVGDWCAAHGIVSPVTAALGGMAPQTAAVVPDVRVIERHVEPAEIMHLRARVERAEAEVQSTRAQLKHAAKRSNILDDVRAMLAPALVDLPDLAAATRRATVKTTRTGDHQIELVVHLADWHVGEVIDPSQVQDQNEYGPAIAAKRAEHVASVVRDWIGHYDALFGVSRVTFTLMGDMASGMHIIHPTEAVEYARIVTQCLDAGLLLAQTIGAVLPLAVPIRVVTTRGGNHPRSTKKPASGEAAAQTNWEHFMYEYLAALLRDADIEWIIGRAYSQRFTVADQRFTIAHGDAIQGGGGSLGIPAYGAKRQTHAEIMSSVLNALHLGDINSITQHIRIGHFHEDFKMRTPTGSFRICPSMKGTGPWELERLGKISPPEQLIEVVHPMRGIIGSHVVDCSKPAGDGFAWGAMRSTHPAFALLDEA